jgi:hypothetical protein
MRCAWLKQKKANYKSGWICRTWPMLLCC